MSETAERLIDLAEAHFRTPDSGASAFATLLPRSASRARACITISPTKATMTAAVARRCGDRFLAAVARRRNERAEDAISARRSERLAIEMAGCASAACSAPRRASVARSR